MLFECAISIIKGIHCIEATDELDEFDKDYADDREMRYNGSQ